MSTTALREVARSGVDIEYAAYSETWKTPTGALCVCVGGLLGSPSSSHLNLINVYC